MWSLQAMIVCYYYVAMILLNVIIASYDSIMILGCDDTIECDLCSVRDSIKLHDKSVRGWTILLLALQWKWRNSTFKVTSILSFHFECSPKSSHIICINWPFTTRVIGQWTRYTDPFPMLIIGQDTLTHFRWLSLVKRLKHIYSIFTWNASK
jgi:hypothetical protein